MKGGALIAASQKKRKYKKSKDIEGLIERSLEEQTFYTAVELSKYIEEKYNRKLSRSIISRHLGEMGYSYKNIKNAPFNKNSPSIKEVRKEFFRMLCPLISERRAKVLFLDHCAFLPTDFPARHHSAPELSPLARGEGECLITALLLASFEEGVVDFRLRDGSCGSEDFASYLETAVEDLKRAERADGNLRILLLDIKDIHRSPRIEELRAGSRAHNVYIWYLPPLSAELNFVEHLGGKIRQQVRAHDYDSPGERREAVEDSIRFYSFRPLSAEAQEIRDYFRKAAQGENL